MFKIQFQLKNLLKNIYYIEIFNDKLIDLYTVIDGYYIGDEKNHRGHEGIGSCGPFQIEGDYDYKLESNFKNVFSWLDPSIVNYSGKIRYGEEGTLVIENIVKGKKNGKFLRFRNNIFWDNDNYSNDKLNGISISMFWNSKSYYRNNKIDLHVMKQYNYKTKITEYTISTEKLKKNIYYWKSIYFNENGEVIEFISKSRYSSGEMKLHKQIYLHENCKALCKLDSYKKELELSFEKLKIKL
jgi:hypothetical protein